MHGDGVEEMVVMGVDAGTSGFRAGVQAGDVVISVDGKPTQNLTYNDVMNLLKEAKAAAMTRVGEQAIVLVRLVKVSNVQAGVVMLIGWASYTGTGTAGGVEIHGATRLGKH